MFREACWTTALSQNISSRKSPRNITTMRYPFYVIPYTSGFTGILSIISVLSSDSSQSLSLNHMSSSEYKLEQDSSPLSDSFSEIYCNKSAFSSGLRAFPSTIVSGYAWRVVGRLEEGQTQAEVVQAIGLSQSVISRIWNHFLETGNAGRRPGQGRRRATTPNEDHYIVLTAQRHRNMNATLQQHLRSATGTTVSTQSVRNQLPGVGLYARRPMVCVRLTSRHRRDRRERTFIWRDRDSRNNPVFVHESVRFVGGDVLVYGGISIDGRTDFYIIRDGLLTARRYRDEILRPIVVPYVAAIGEDFILMDDNCRPHHANLVEDFLFEEGFVRMEWPACSSDMNPIEHVWDALGRRVLGLQPPPQTLQELERALLEEWDRIPQLVINSLIDSLPQRCSTLLAVRGNHTPY
ncbi:transposable element Tcb1 transposase [Trichonephila clavipes]|nr:transposable element Tcb1 transposase [Trichonephila clavipes]